MTTYTMTNGQTPTPTPNFVEGLSTIKGIKELLGPHGEHWRQGSSLGQDSGFCVARALWTVIHQRYVSVGAANEAFTQATMLLIGAGFDPCIPTTNDSVAGWDDINRLLDAAIENGHRQVVAGLDGPSRTIVVEPIETPQQAPIEEEPETPVETPDREPVPA